MGRLLIILWVGLGFFIQGIPRCDIGIESFLSLFASEDHADDHHCDEATPPKGAYLSDMEHECPCQVEQFSLAMIMHTAKVLVEPSIDINWLSSPPYRGDLLELILPPLVPPPRVLSL